MVDKHSVNELANFIEGHKVFKFDMASPWREGCGSAGCIGGFAATLWPDVQGKYDNTQWNDERLMNRLGISWDQHDHLTMIMYSGHVHDTITRADAVACLRNLAETGKVHWPQLKRFGEHLAEPV